VLQLPIASLKPIELMIDLGIEKNFPATVGIFVLLVLPYFFVVTMISTGATFYSVLQAESGKGISLRTTIKQTQSKLGNLVLAGLLVGLVMTSGFVAFILPAIYFFAVYFFVPQTIMIEPRVSIWVYLYRATRLAKKALKRVLLLVLALFAIELGMEAVAQITGTLATGLFQSVIFQFLILALVEMLLVILASSVIHVWMGHYFLYLRNVSEAQ